MSRSFLTDDEIKKILPSHIHFFDFGNGVTSVPMYDPKGDGWLTTSLSILIDDKGRGLRVEWDGSAGISRMAVALKRAVDLFDEQAKVPDDNIYATSLRYPLARKQENK